jgi:aminocarboxymuconate-semialdehyde decarboxylase
VHDTSTSAALVVDVHAHALPLPLLQWLEGQGLADLSGVRSGVITIAPELSGLAPGAPIPFPPEQYDLAAKLVDMDRTGVDVQAVSAPPFVFGSECDDPRLVMEVTRRSNDALADFIAGSTGRLVGLATVPVGIAGAAEELRRSRDELGFAGAAVGTFGGGCEVDDSRNDDLWAAADLGNCFVLMHPSRVSGRERLGAYHLVQLLGYPVETALATSRLVFGGVLDRHNLVLCLAHGGGCVPSIGGRLNLGWDRKSVARVTPQRPTEYLQRLHYDTAVFDTTLLKRVVEDYGASRVLLGTDAPFDLADREPVDTVRSLGLNMADEQAILGGNATRLLQGLAEVVPQANVGATVGRARSEAQSLNGDRPHERQDVMR